MIRLPFRAFSIAVVSLSLVSCGDSSDSSNSSSSTTSTGGASSSGGDGGSGAGLPTGELTWNALEMSGAPSARYAHSAVWTGSEMIIWGGATAEKPSATASGAIYDPQAKSWRPTSTAGAPAARSGHTAVWTGSRMIVWGGYGELDYVADGAAYDPETDTWTPIATAGQPDGRLFHTATWADDRMVVWGGAVAATPLANGGIYDPAADAWTTISPVGAPSKRFSHSAVWTGKQLIFWGGYDFFDWLQDGRFFDPTAAGGGSWVGPTATEGAPWRRDLHTAVWAPPRMIIWGGWIGGPYENTGGLLDTSAGETGAWTATSTKSAPAPRAENIRVWTGSELVVWGGCGGDQCLDIYADGGRFTPNDSGGTWSPVAAQTALAGRRAATAVFTGSSVIVWGGRTVLTDLFDTGAESAH